MTNLPITSNPIPTAVTPKNGAPADDAAATGPAFGDVLARQVASPEGTDAKAVDAKTTLRKMLDGLGDLKGNDTGLPSATDPTAALNAAAPTDMLAALLPQMLPANPASTTGTVSANEPGQRLASLTGHKDAATTLPGLATEALQTTPLNGKAVADAAQGKESSFAATLDTQAGSLKTALGSLTEKIEMPLTAAIRQPEASMLTTLQNTAAQIAAPLTLPTQLTVDTPISHDKWADDFNQKITWLAGQKEQSAELHLNPPDLGPLDVVLKVSGDQATALFTSPHAAVRDAIEQALPKLRDMMADNGIMLGNATVNDQTPRDNNPGSFGNAQSQGDTHGRREAGTPTDVAASGTIRVSPISRHNGIVDTFA